MEPFVSRTTSSALVDTKDGGLHEILTCLLLASSPARANQSVASIRQSFIRAREQSDVDVQSRLTALSVDDELRTK